MLEANKLIPDKFVCTCMKALSVKDDDSTKLQYTWEIKPRLKYTWEINSKIQCAANALSLIIVLIGFDR